MNNTKKNVKAVDVGSFISEEYSNQLQQSFKETYPKMETRFTFSKSLMLKVLNSSKAITGIRFMYGLEDESNQSSIKLILVPCTNATEYAENSKPLIFSSGYHDNHGDLKSIRETGELIARFVKHIKDNNDSLEYRNITRGAFVGKNSLLALSEGHTCKYVALNFGLRKDVIEPVFEPLNINLVADQKIYLDFVHACPPFCDPGTSPSTNACFGTLALELKGKTDNEKRFFLNLRDRTLFTLKDGATYYEMFHFISPIVSLLIPKLINQNEVLSNMYTNRLAPLKDLITQERFDEATTLIANGLDELIEEFETTKVEDLLQEVV